jgi:hypothetical protein
VTPEKALDRARKLLALATSPDVHEAAAAAAQAQELITRHRLAAFLDAERDASDERDPIVDARTEPLDVARRQRPWKVALAGALAEVNGCLAYTLESEAGEAIVLAGRARDREAVATLWAWLLKRIEWLSATHGAGRPRRWHEAFRVGAVDAVAARLRGAEAAVRGESTGAALALIDEAIGARRAALDRYAAEHLNLGRGRARRVDAAAWLRGRVAGEGMKLP